MPHETAVQDMGMRQPVLAMSANSTIPIPIWPHFSDACRPMSVEFLGNYGGFSGARLWRADTSVGPLCLRAWPSEFRSERQLTFIHDVLSRVRAVGLNFIPAPQRTRDGATFNKG